MSFNKTMGEKITEARDLVSPRMSRNELAKRLKDAGIDISPEGVAHIEAGKRFLNYYEVSALASILNTNSSQLLSCPV
jgi:hypothetical protein